LFETRVMFVVPLSNDSLESLGMQSISANTTAPQNLKVELKLGSSSHSFIENIGDVGFEILKTDSYGIPRSTLEVETATLTLCVLKSAR